MINTKLAADLMIRFPFHTIRTLEEIDFILEFAKGHRDTLLANMIRSGVDPISSTAQQNVTFIHSPMLPVPVPVPTVMATRPDVLAPTIVQTHEETTEEELPAEPVRPKFNKWGESPPPVNGLTEYQEEESSSSENEVKGDLPKVNFTNILQEEEKARELRKKTTSISNFCGQKGKPHNCTYTFRGESDVVHFNTKLIQPTTLCIVGLPRDVNPEYIRQQIYGSLPAKLKPAMRKPRKKNEDDPEPEARPDIVYNAGGACAFVGFLNHQVATQAFHELQKPQTAVTLQKIKVNFASHSK